jgi:hypothetical protein
MRSFLHHVPAAVADNYVVPTIPRRSRRAYAGDQSVYAAAVRSCSPEEARMACVVALRIPPGRTEAVRRLTAECLGPRKADDDLMRRGGYTEEAYWLQPDPEQGDLLFAVSSRNHARFDQIMANPQTAFDHWWRDQWQAIFGPEGAEPADSEPRNELLGTWRA